MQLLIGSANVLLLPGLSDSLAGRMEVLRKDRPLFGHLLESFSETACTLSLSRHCGTEEM